MNSAPRSPNSSRLNNQLPCRPDPGRRLAIYPSMPATLHQYALTSLAAVKQFADITTNADDDLLVQLINSATDLIERRCGRRFAKTTYAGELQDGDGSDELLLNQYPIAADEPVEVSIDGVALNPTEFQAYDQEGMLYRRARWPRGHRNVSIAYTAGYETIPADLAQAANEIVTLLYRRRKNLESSSEKVGEFSVSYNPLEESPLARQIISLYERNS